NPEEVSVAAILRCSEEFAHSLYPAEGVHMLTVAQLKSPSVHFLVARNVKTGDVLGCGAIVLQSGSYAEIKRMFVNPVGRRKGIGAEILKALEKVARTQGVRTLRLETGPNQPEALALYRRSGYWERGPFGEYREDSFSIFMEKCID